MYPTDSTNCIEEICIIMKFFNPSLRNQCFEKYLFLFIKNKAAAQKSIFQDYINELTRTDIIISQ